MAIRLSTDMPSSLFDHVKTAEPNAVFRLNAKFGKDANTDKLNLGIGAFRDDFGNTVVMDVVKKEEHDMAVEIGDGRMNHEYPAMGGSAGLVRLSAELLLGQNSATIKNDLVHGVQTVSGTGALKVAADFLARHHDERVVYISDPTWENHRRIFAEAGHEVRKYRYYDDETRGLDMGGLMEDLSEAPPGAVVVMHACAHNPTGVDLTPNEWRELAELCQARRFVVVFDSAYLGLVTGNPERDAHALRLFDSMGLTFFVCKSYSKIFGLYSERCGVALFRGSTAAECKAVNSQLKVITRGIWSVPPMHGAHIVERILGDPKKNKAWRAELKSMSDRIARTRQQLYNELTRRDPEGSWTHVIEQGGMFTYTGLSPQQCDVLKRDNHIYMLRSGRINVSGIPADQVARLAAAICEAKRKTAAADAASPGIDAAAAADVSVATAAATPLPSDADSINSVEAFEGESSGDDAASGPAN